MFFPYTRRVTNLNHLTIDLPHFSAILPNFRNAFSSGISIIICTTITSFTQGGERTSQSRDQNIETEYKFGNFASLRTGKIDFFNTLVLPLRNIASAKYENNFVLVIFA